MGLMYFNNVVDTGLKRSLRGMGEGWSVQLFYAKPSVTVASNFARSLKRQTQLMNLAQVSLHTLLMAKEGDHNLSVLKYVVWCPQ